MFCPVLSCRLLTAVGQNAGHLVTVWYVTNRNILGTCGVRPTMLGLMTVQISDAGSERAAFPPADLQQAD